MCTEESFATQFCKNEEIVIFRKMLPLVKCSPPHSVSPCVVVELITLPLSGATQLISLSGQERAGNSTELSQAIIDYNSFQFCINLHFSNFRSVSIVDP